MTLPDARHASLLAAAAAAALLASAFAFQHLGGLIPCPLCIWQRWPYAAVVVLGAIGWLAPGIARLALAACALAFAIDAGIAFYHVGVEQHWWAGTAECTAQTAKPASSIEEMRARILAAPIVRCDDIPWSLLGISMAGWNGLAAFALTIASGAYLLRTRP
ncbi:MAG: disulfide bond formation protein B [Alphaproteobacteria bacterium]|nr:disulfide bond formation protein B [Alphaproteobacteria bacterium]